ncbi:MAG: hypothetical protein IT182_02710 [Acidobacteria bacterium]|nr:hypothetical protein [Acidobacteriota bacterium]
MHGWRATGGAMVIAVLAATGSASGQTTERVSLSAAGAQAIGGRYAPRPSIGAEGTTVAFESPIATLVTGDTNDAVDIFVAAGGVLTRVMGTGNVQPNCTSQRPSVSADGRYVSFDSCATNMVAGDTNNLSDVFVLDRSTNIVTRVSVSTAGTQATGGPSYASAISPNGRYVAFLSQASNLDGAVFGTYAYLRDTVGGTTHLVSRMPAGNLMTSDVRPSVADNGTVAFASATNVPALDDSNGVSDVYLRVGATGGSPTTVRASVSATGASLAALSTRPSISADGQLVAFETAAPAVPADTNGLTDIYVRDITQATTVLVSRTAGGNGGNGNSMEAFIAAGAGSGHVSFTSNANDLAGAADAVTDVFRASLSRAPLAVTGVTRASVPVGSATGSSSASGVALGGRVAFASDEPLVANDVNGDTDVYTFDGTATRISVTAPGSDPTYSGRSLRPSPSYAGTFVAFLSSATNLVDGDRNGRTDVFVRNRTTGETERVPVPLGHESTDADWVTISHDGRFVAFSRGAAFLYDRFDRVLTPVSTATPGGTAVAAAQPRVSASGRYVVFLTPAQLEPADTNAVVDVYRFDRLSGTNLLVSRGATAANGGSSAPTISGDGSRVAFSSLANNLVAGDTNARSDVFVRDIAAGTTMRISTNVDAQPTTIDARDPFISTDGLHVGYLLSSNVLTSEATASSDVYVARTDGSVIRGPLNGISEGTGTTEGAYDPTLSMFGRFLVFRSYAPTLAAGDTNGAADVFGRQIMADPLTPAFGAAQLLTTPSAGGTATGGTGFDSENPEIAGTGTFGTYQSGFTNLVPGDTNGMVDVFARAGIFGNGECDYIEATLSGYAAWLAQFGVDSCSDSGSPYADPDGDGATNEQERQGGGDGNPVHGVFTRYFAEGATKTAALDFDTRIALANPSGATVTGEITYQLPSGTAVPPTPFTLLPYERKTVLLDEQPGIAETGPDVAYEFSTTVKASAPIGVDRTMTWDKSTYGAHAETGVVSPSRKWYFAEGATISGFNLFYLLQNPSNAPVTVEARYLLGTGVVHSKSYELEPNSRFNVWANVEVINGDRPLQSAELSAEFTVTAGAAIIAERAMYRGSSPLFKAGHESAGITAPATEWFLAEGNAGEFFDDFVLIGNTMPRAALVQADFIVGNTGTIYSKQYTVDGNSRFNIWVDQQEVAPGQFPFRTGNTDVSVRIRSLNDVPIIVERAMWWPGSSSTWYEAHNSPGSTQTASRWVLAEGEHGGAIGWRTYILVANTGASPGTIRVRLLLPGGQTSVLAGLSLAAQSRTTYFLGDLLEEAGLPTDSQAGVLIESEGTPLPLVVERAMYRNANGVSFRVGTNALGTPLP